MKYILILLIITTAAQAQTPIQAYQQQPITIGPPNLGKDTLDNGYIIGRYAEFQTLILNTRTKEVTLQVKCYVRTNNDKPVGIKPITVELKASSSTYNLVSTGDPIGTIGETLEKYGYKDMVIIGEDTTYDWRKDAQGRFLTSVAITDGYSMYTKMMDETDIRLRTVIRQTMLKPSNMKIIIDALKQQVSQ